MRSPQLLQTNLLLDRIPKYSAFGYSKPSVTRTLPPFLICPPQSGQIVTLAGIFLVMALTSS